MAFDKAYEYVKANGMPPMPAKSDRSSSALEARKTRETIERVLRRRPCADRVDKYTELRMLVDESEANHQQSQKESGSRVGEVLDWIKEHKRLPTAADDADPLATRVKNVVQCVCTGFYPSDPHTPQLIKQVALLKNKPVDEFEVSVWVRTCHMMMCLATRQQTHPFVNPQEKQLLSNRRKGRAKLALPSNMPPAVRKRIVTLHKKCQDECLRLEGQCKAETTRLHKECEDECARLLQSEVEVELVEVEDGLKKLEADRLRLLEKKEALRRKREQDEEALEGEPVKKRVKN